MGVTVAMDGRERGGGFVVEGCRETRARETHDKERGGGTIMMREKKKKRMRRERVI